MRNMEIKAVFVDLDGTLLHGMETITPRTVRAFEQICEKGIIPVIATGRPAYEADFAAQAIGADQYFIVMNGAAVYQKYYTGEILYEAHLPKSSAEQVFQILSGKDVFFEIYAGSRALCQEDYAPRIQHCGMTEEQARFFSANMLKVNDLNAYLAEKELAIHKFFISVGSHEEVASLRTEIEQVPGLQTLTSGEHFIEVVPEGVDKQSAVRAVREACGLSRDQIMVIGDSENDLGMFDEALTRVAMGNACSELKAKANYIAPPNTEDGVAWALETLLLGEYGPHPFTGQIESLWAEEIAQSLAHSSRQYLAGDLKLPQELHFLRDTAVEVGINHYTTYKWELPHYHTVTSEYCYMLAGETKYIDLSDGREYNFRTGDFYILRRDTPYLQKCLPGFHMLFVKVPGLNDKVTIPLNDQMLAWCESWEAEWDSSGNLNTAKPEAN